MSRKIRERDILKAITDYLQLLENQRKLFFVRVGSGGIQTSTGKWFKSGKRGCADLLVLYQSIWYSLEVKVPKNKQSLIQKENEKLIKNCGGEYFVVHSVSEVEKILF